MNLSQNQKAVNINEINYANDQRIFFQKMKLIEF
ncbi:MAG: hypothetical protein CM15mP102_15000 [Flavobacteriales bacterium]|nr:MAG: hypothetical protein CM15mP102_15000 [Flavobacteriales bacterium]